MELTLPLSGAEVDPDLVASCERYAHFSAQLLVIKSAYGDDIERLRRRSPMSVASELLWRLLPPLTFATDDVVISGLVEPAYDIGGDAFDYAVNGTRIHVAVLDAMGHGLTAAGLTSFALSAYRNTRIAGDALDDSYAAMHAAISEAFEGERYVTAVLLELDLDTGLARWLNAGHPAPLLVRDGRVVKTLEARPAFPLGLPLEPIAPEIGAESLEPGDQILLYTDGFPEARLPDGELFGLERLTDFVEREASAARPAPETLRRLRRTLLEERQSQLRDDATAVLLAWRSGGERVLLPETVP
jgi:serine phosphatase RsbU (regulator of sigma subunit)